MTKGELKKFKLDIYCIRVIKFFIIKSNENILQKIKKPKEKLSDFEKITGSEIAEHYKDYENRQIYINRLNELKTNMFADAFNIKEIYESDDKDANDELLMYFAAENDSKNIFNNIIGITKDDRHLNSKLKKLIK